MTPENDLTRDEAQALLQGDLNDPEVRAKLRGFLLADAHAFDDGPSFVSIVSHSRHLRYRQDCRSTLLADERVIYRRKAEVRYVASVRSDSPDDVLSYGFVEVPPPVCCPWCGSHYIVHKELLVITPNNDIPNGLVHASGGEEW